MQKGKDLNLERQHTEDHIGLYDIFDPHMDTTECCPLWLEAHNSPALFHPRWSTSWSEIYP